jgi:hypothetical protein
VNFDDPFRQLIQAMSSRITTAFKFMHQFGLRPLALFSLYKLGVRTGFYKRKTAKRDSIALLFTPLFSLPSRETLLDILGTEGLGVLLNEADEILEGKVRIFGELVPLQFAFDGSLHHWTEYEADSRLLSTLHSLTSDIKFIWEPARFGWAFILGRAWHATQDDKYAVAFWKYFEDFVVSNPPDMGPHWMNGQEMAIRMLALVWAAHVFETAPATSSVRREALIQGIHMHASRIPSTLIYARSQNNNHLTTEAAAIYTAGLFFKDAKWRALGWKWLLWSFRNQIGDFGEYIQHSINYHRLMLGTALWINFIRKDIFPASVTQSLARAAHWLFSLVDNDSGHTPNLGSNDGALIFPLSVSGYEDYRPTAQAAARAFLRANISAGPWDEISLWLGLQENSRVTDSSMYLTDNLRAKNSWAYLRASTFKSRLSHMDQLHLDLWWRGLNIAQDAGTYLYNAEPPWDNSLVTTRVHNTVMVDDRDQMTRAGRFLVLDWAGGYSKPVIELDETILHKIKGYFHGYRRWGVRHERMVTVFADEFWRVEDRLLNTRRRSHVYRLHWLLPDWEWSVDGGNEKAEINLKSPHGLVKLAVHANQGRGKLSIVRAGELVHGERDVKPYEGWVSRNYGSKSPALSVAFEVSSPYHTSITSEFTFPK